MKYFNRDLFAWQPRVVRKIYCPHATLAENIDNRVGIADCGAHADAGGLE